MRTWFLSLMSSLVLGLALLIGLGSTASAQVRVTVGGQIYDITANLGSFDTVQTNTGNQLTNTATAPWFGSMALAETFRDEWISAATTTAIPTGDTIAFAYNTNVDAETAFNNGPNYSSSGFTGASTGFTNIFGSDLYYATATPVFVPEINGSSLAQVLLVLFVGYLMVRARRRISPA